MGSSAKGRLNVSGMQTNSSAEDLDNMQPKRFESTEARFQYIQEGIRKANEMRPKETALPREWIASKYKLIEDGKLHPKKRSHVTRRDMTEMRI